LTLGTPKNSILASKKTTHLHHKDQLLILYKKIIAVYSKKYMEHINTLCGDNEGLVNFEAGGIYRYHYALKG
jgi:hypothetical protein